MLNDFDTFLQTCRTQCLKMTRISNLSKIGKVDQRLKRWIQVRNKLIGLITCWQKKSHAFFGPGLTMSQKLVAVILIEKIDRSADSISVVDSRLFQQPMTEASPKAVTIRSKSSLWCCCIL